MYNTRIAPSPTGNMHIGTARTAYFNWLAARSTGGKFYLRIDDTDIKRNRPEYTQLIIDIMDWLKLDYDEIVYQSSRFDRYKSLAIDFIERGKAQHIDGAICLKPDVKPEKWYEDTIGWIKITDDDLDNVKDMVLIKSDGSPAYNWASVVDDIDYNINFVIRGIDHLTNTSKQVVLYNMLGAELPRYSHVSLIGNGGKPLSKRDGAASVLTYKDYNPEALLNFLVRMGWGPRVDDKTTKTLPRERMLELFLSGGKMRNSFSNFDLDKLNSFNRKYNAR